MKKGTVAFGLFIAMLILQFISFFLVDPYKFILLVINLALIAAIYLLIKD